MHSFNGTLNDVYTLAHELGHATHDYYDVRSQTLMNTSMPSIVAETASIFGELLLRTCCLTRQNQMQSAKRFCVWFWMRQA